jgi:cysteine-rich repeat protein
MRRFLPSTCLLFSVACEPSTGGIKEADEVGDADDSGTDDATSESADEACVVGSVDCMCTPGGGCDPGLECVGDMCIDPDATTSETESSESEESETETDTGSCTMLGCPCEDVDGACDPGLVCEDGTCQAETCGNGVLDVGEACDDGNRTDVDGCDSDCTVTEVLALAAGDRHNCALIEGGRIRCWGEGYFGQLGRGNVDNIGDNETPGSAGDLPLPAAALAIDAGEAHTCAWFDDLTLRCWGQNYYGQLGYGNAGMMPLIGDDEPIDMLGGVDVGGAPLDSFALGGRHGCARLDDSKIRCWGGNAYGQLGLANTVPIGDDEPPAFAMMMFLGADANQVATGDSHTCAITKDGYVRCWGRGSRGQLGYGNNMNIGDGEPPANAGDIQVVPASLPANTPVTALALGREHSCALFQSGDVVCWGFNDAGQLATGNNQDWGDQAGETPSALEPIDLGGPAVALAAGNDHTCALLDDGSVRCWGENERGQLGLGHTDDVGIGDTPAQAGPLALGGSAAAIVAGGEHSCALLEDHSVVCWGYNMDGRLGYGHIQQIGDNEDPEIAGNVELW